MYVFRLVSLYIVDKFAPFPELSLNYEIKQTLLENEFPDRKKEKEREN